MEPLKSPFTSSLVKHRKSMDLYNSSPAARAVWDAVDEHLLAVYGFSIINIVKHNPKEKTIYFGGIKGQDV